MSKKVTSAANQQGSRSVDLSKFIRVDPSETTRRAPVSNNIVKAYLLGAIHDGTLNKSKRFRISQKGTDWLKIIQKLFVYLGYNSWIYKEGKDREVYVLETLADFLDFKFDPLKLRTDQEKQAYIRGFFDAEGGIPHNKEARFYIQLVQKDKQKLLMIAEMLKQMNIVFGKIHNPSVRVDPNYWRMYILSESRADFVKIIGSWHPKKMKILNDRMKI